MSLRSEVRLEKVVRGCHMGRMDTRHGDLLSAGTHTLAQPSPCTAHTVSQSGQL